MKILDFENSGDRKRAAGCILFCPDTKRFCLALRGLREVNYPNHWSTWGGKCDPGESPEYTTLRELGEEAGYYGKINLVPMLTNIGNDRVYFNFLGVVPNEFNPKLNWENSEYKWIHFGHWPKPLHPGVRELLADDDSLDLMRQYAEIDK